MTSGRRRTAVALVALIAVASGVYLWRLADAPIYLTRDEVFMGLIGQSLASRGRDLEGHLLPFFVYSRVNGTWWPPMLVYAIAAVLKVLPFSEAAVRTPMALAAVANVVLAFLVGRLLTGRTGVAFCAALLLALAPAHVIENRYANDTSLPATFALGWMLALLLYFARGSSVALCAAGLTLGAGAYSYVGAMLLMPVYALLTTAALSLRRDRVTRHLIFAAAFAVPFLLGVWWLVRHPAALETTFLHYQRDELHDLGAAGVARASTTIGRAMQAAALYARFWNPRVLFVDNVPWLMHSTGRAGVLLLPAVGLLLVGLARELRRAIADPRALVLVGAFLLAPIPACLVDPEEHTALYATWRAFALVPFGALLAGSGLDAVLAPGGLRFRFTAVSIAVAVPLALLIVYRDHAVGPPITLVLVAASVTACGVAVFVVPHANDMGERTIAAALALLATLSLFQFADFYRDYLGDYQQRFTVETDGNVREVLESVMDALPPAPPSAQRPPVAYLAFRLGAGDWGANYWLFYLHKHHREDLIGRTVMETADAPFTRDRACWLPPSSRIAIPIDGDRSDASIRQMVDGGAVAVEGLLGQLRGRPRYWLLRTTGSCGST